MRFIVSLAAAVAGAWWLDGAERFFHHRGGGLFSLGGCFIAFGTVSLFVVCKLRGLLSRWASSMYICAVVTAVRVDSSQP